MALCMCLEKLAFTILPQGSRVNNQSDKAFLDRINRIKNHLHRPCKPAMRYCLARQCLVMDLTTVEWAKQIS